MRRLLLLVLAVGLTLQAQALLSITSGVPYPSGGGSAPSVLHTAAQSNTGGGSTCNAADISVSNGDVVVAILSTTSGGTSITPAFTDGNSLGNTFTQVTGSPWADNSSGMKFVVWKSTITNAGTIVPSLSDGNGNSFWKSCGLIAISSSTLDKQAVENGVTNDGVTAFVTGTTATTGFANELLVSVFGSKTNNTWTAGSGQTQQVSSQASTDSSTYIETKSVSSTGTYQGAATASASTSGVGLILTFH